MTNVKSSAVTHYELLFIISNKYSEEELNPIIEKVKKIIKNNKGNITYSEEWGKKKMTYPIKHFNYGYYNLFEFDVCGDQVVKIDKDLRMNNKVLRHQIINKKPRAEKEIKKINKKKGKVEKDAAQIKKQEELAIEKTKGKINLRDLDDKLDKILETDDLL